MLVFYLRKLKNYRKVDSMHHYASRHFRYEFPCEFVLDLPMYLHHLLKYTRTFKIISTARQLYMVEKPISKIINIIKELL